MLKKIRTLIALYRVRKWFKPAENHELSRLGNLYGVPRLVFDSKGEDTEAYHIYIPYSQKSGWLENDEHYRKRINKHLNLKGNNYGS